MQKGKVISLIYKVEVMYKLDKGKNTATNTTVV